MSNIFIQQNCILFLFYFILSEDIHYILLFIYGVDETNRIQIAVCAVSHPLKHLRLVYSNALINQVQPWTTIKHCYVSMSVGIPGRVHVFDSRASAS